MNKKIILLVAVLLIVALVFVACKGNDNDESTTESTTESTVAEVEINDMSDELDSDILSGVIVEGDMSGEGIINVGGQESTDGEDSISWDEVIGNNS